MGQHTIYNRLLTMLPRSVYGALQSRLRPVHLKEKEHLYEPGETINSVYFPTSAVVTELTVMENGSSIEIATVGNEGMLGVPLFLGVDRALGRAVVDVPGEALRMKSEDFLEACRQESVRTVLGRYIYAVVRQMAYFVGCSRFHSLKARCARWLLLRQERTAALELPFTQDFLARLLGVRRTTVSTTITELVRAGLLSHRRGKIKIENRFGLHAMACECYRFVKQEWDSLFRSVPEEDHSTKD